MTHRGVAPFGTIEGGHARVSEDQLAAALAADLDGAFEQLALCYQRRLYAFALRVCGSREDAEEIVQDALIRAYRALAGYPSERRRALAVRPWLFQITINVARNRARVRRPATASLDGAEAATLREPADDEREQPEARAETAERRRELARLLLALPMRYRPAVVLRHVEGLCYDEIAAILQQPVGTVKANVHRGVGLLRAALEREPVEVR
jgi:RNA polymerase sigma-70 factor (ECF subfamily)